MLIVSLIQFYSATEIPGFAAKMAAPRVRHGRFQHRPELFNLEVHPEDI
jgi:hypothetical protein